MFLIVRKCAQIVDMGIKEHFDQIKEEEEQRAEEIKMSVFENNTHNDPPKQITNSNSSYGCGIRGIILLIVFIIGLVSCVKIIKSDNKIRNTECDWCGKEEECKQYCVQSLDGYNKDGSIKYKYEYLYFSESCHKKAKDNGAKYGWTNIVPVD